MGEIQPISSWADGIATNITRLISERGTNKHAVQQASGIPRSTFYRKIDQKPESFTVDELARIADTLGVTFTGLVRVA